MGVPHVGGGYASAAGYPHQQARYAAVVAGKVGTLRDAIGTVYRHGMVLQPYGLSYSTHIVMMDDYANKSPAEYMRRDVPD